MYLFLISGGPTFPVICHAGTLAVVKIRHWTHLLICTIKPASNFCRWKFPVKSGRSTPAARFCRRVSSAISISTLTMCSIGNVLCTLHMHMVINYLWNYSNKLLLLLLPNNLLVHCGGSKASHSNRGVEFDEIQGVYIKSVK